MKVISFLHISLLKLNKLFKLGIALYFWLCIILMCLLKLTLKFNNTKQRRGFHGDWAKDKTVKS